MTQSTHTVTIAQALLSSATGLLVLDSAAPIAASAGNMALVARVASFTVVGTTQLNLSQMLALSSLGSVLHAATGSLQLSGAATVSVAQLVALEALPGLSLSSLGSLTLSDSTANIAGLLAAHPGYFAQVAGVVVHLDGTSIGAYPAVQLNGLAVHGKALSFVASPGHTTLNVSATAHDLGSNAASLNALALRQPLSLALTNEGAVVSASDAGGLAQLGGFQPGAHNLTVADSGAALQAASTRIFGAGFTQIQVTSGTFAGSAAQLLDPTLHFGAVAHAALSTSASLSGTMAAQLVALPGFTLTNLAALTVTDNATGLAASAAGWLHTASAAVLTGDATVTAATLASLAHIAATLPNGLSLGGHALTVNDTLDGLLGLSPQATSLASALSLGTDAVATAAQVNAFAALPQASLGGHAITVADTAGNLLGLHGAALADASAAALTGDAQVTAGQLNTLAGLPHFALNGHALAVTGSASDLLALSPAALALASSFTLSADATVSARAAEALFAEPGFSAGAFHLTIADTAANLLALPVGEQIAASNLALFADQAVSAAALTALAGLGIKFSTAGHSVTCADSAANLTSLSPAALALAGGEVMNTASTVSAAAYTALAALPHLTVGAPLVLQDSVANLLGLAASPTLATSVQLLPNSVVALNAAQAIALFALPHFALADASITITDTVAALTAGSGGAWPANAVQTHVADTAAHLVASALAPVVLGAAQVSLTANGTVSAAGAAQIAGIPHFIQDAFSLTVADTAANVAAYAGAIGSVIGGAVVTDSGPLNAASADLLVGLSDAGKLSFLGGNQLVVQDSFAALTSAGNATGVALAARLSVMDTAANLAAAAAHDWGGINPTYTLTASGVATAAQAIVLAGLGGHFSEAGYSLNVTDTAAQVANAGPALAALHATATVTDSAAAIGAHEIALAGLGAALTAIQVTDMQPVSAAVAAGLAGLANKWSGVALSVADSAGNVAGVEAGLATLGAHVAVTVTDSAADVAPLASTLAGLHGALNVALTDIAPVSAAVAAGLAPVVAELAPGTTVSVLDTGAAVASSETSLAALGNALGIITLQDGTTQTASVAGSLVPLDSHLAAGVQLTVTGSPLDIAQNLPGLLVLQADHRLAGVVVNATSTADLIEHASALNALPCTLNLSTSAADVLSELEGLAGLSGLAAIHLTDPGTPALTMDTGMLGRDASAIATITTPYRITVSDSGNALSTDLSLGSDSTILAHLSQIGSIVSNDAQPVTLTQSQLFQPGVDDGVGSAMAKYAGSLHVTGLDLQNLGTINALAHVPDQISVADSGAAIVADLASGASTLVAHVGSIDTIRDSDSAAVTLSVAQVTAAGVDDGPASVLAKLHGGSLSVTGAAVADLAMLQALTVSPSSITVSDTAANISGDIASGHSHLLGALDALRTVTVSDGLPITMTEAQLLHAGVDDGTGSLMSHIVGGSLAVTDAVAGDLNLLLGLDVAPGSIAITDSAAHVLSHLASVEADLGHIASITITGAPLTLSADEALAPGADDGAGSLASRIVGGVFDVTGATVAQFAALQARPDVPASVSLADSSANLVGDLTSGASVLAAYLGDIGTLTVSHGTLSLTDGQAQAILADPALDSVMGKLAPATVVSVSDVSVSDLGSIAASLWPHLSVALTDTPQTIAADLAQGPGSAILGNTDVLTSVTLNGSGTVSAASLSGMTVLPGFSDGLYTLNVADTAAAVLGISTQAASFAHAISISDNDANVSAVLDALQTRFGGHLSITLSNASPAIQVDSAHYAADQPTIDAITNPGAVTVTGNAAALAAQAAALAGDPVVSNVAVTDSARDVIANLGALEAAGNKLTVNLTDSSLTAAEVEQLAGLGNLGPANLLVADNGSALAALMESGNAAAILYVQTHPVQLWGGSLVTAADAAALLQITGLSQTHQVGVCDIAAHLANPAYTTAIESGLVSNVYLKAPGNNAVVSAATLAGLINVGAVWVSTPWGRVTVTVSDTAAHIDANLPGITGNADNVVVNTSAIISLQTLSDLRGIGATTAPGVALTVSDTAANIADHAGDPAGSGNIQPIAWSLSANGTVTEAEAVTLGNLAHFNAGTHTITIALTQDTGILLSDALALGNIAGSLNLNGHHLTVAGTIAQLSTLPQAALNLVTPQVFDSFADVAALPANSPLLHGTIEINDGAPVTTAQAASVLNLAASLPPGALVIDHAHAIVDSVVNIFALQSSAAWVHEPALQGQFSWTAQGSVAELINPASTGFLAGLSGTTLAGDVTVDAASATALAGLASQIHFNAGGAQITVADTAAGLLDPSHASGLALAGAVILSGTAQVDAADAEALLNLSNFHLAAPLTIVDSSANLLDGILANDITASGLASHISLQLAGPETLDADTAEQVVSLPGFADGHNLNIADDPAYLLNSANLIAEQMANSVTLSGSVEVSTNTVLRLSEVPHFTPGNSTLFLDATENFADGVTLKAILDDGRVESISPIQLTQDVLNLTPAEYSALGGLFVDRNGHALGVEMASVTVTPQALQTVVAGTGVAGGTVHVYDQTGLLLTSHTSVSAGFTVTVPVTGANFAITETAGGVEGAPVVVLDAGALENAVATAHGNFAGSGAIQVGAGEFLDLYTAGSVPQNLAHAALVYDPNAHTVTLDIAGHAPVTLITLGGTAHPASLDVQEILIQHHG